MVPPLYLIVYYLPLLINCRCPLKQSVSVQGSQNFCGNRISVAIGLVSQWFLLCHFSRGSSQRYCYYYPPLLLILLKHISLFFLIHKNCIICVSLFCTISKCHCVFFTFSNPFIPFLLILPNTLLSYWTPIRVHHYY